MEEGSSAGERHSLSSLLIPSSVLKTLGKGPSRAWPSDGDGDGDGGGGGVMASRMQRSSISPFRSRKSPVPATNTARNGGRATTPSSTSSVRPTTPSSLRGATRPTTPSSTTSSTSARPAAAGSDLSPRDLADRPDFSKSKENVTVTVRFRPLSLRELNKGDEVAWYADGDYTVRNEYNPSIAYAFDRVFGPATTTRHVYDIAAQHVVSDAMEGINGIVFAYGVTSSGKTHTMHGDQRSPGIIPLAVKEVFNIIQETPGREFLLRVSYLEIYNEVINDLLDPIGQNLRIREDAQGTYVEGIKEEVVLSPAHALSLIASGEEHRHVGSNNFNLLSSRSHTIFTLTIESSPCDNQGEEDVRLSQLNLIDLAGSESSKTETTGLRRKEGSFINKSLLTLGTVISKLTDGKATHVPFRDSKLTRLLQSSLGGHGKISLICTVTPASSNIEETHNTLKFAHRSKHVEIKASQNKIMDEKSLIKKYQKEISTLKEELQQLRRGMMERPLKIGSDQEDLVTLKLQLEAGKIKLQSRLEEEEQAKAALMGRIQRLTKLILVSTKNTIPSNISGRAEHRRRHSFGEDELAYLPDKKREYVPDDDVVSLDSEFSAEGKLNSNSLDESIKFDRKNGMRGMLGWFKIKKHENASGFSSGGDNDSLASRSPSFSQVSQPRSMIADMKDERRKSLSRKEEDPCSFVNSFSERTQAGDLFTVAVSGQRPPPTGMTITDQMDLLREQVKMVAGEVALSTSSLKRLQEQAINKPEDSHIQEQMRKLKNEINEKKLQMRLLEQRILGSSEAGPSSPKNMETSKAVSKLTSQLNEKMFELEITSADNRILQEQLQLKISENAEIQETVLQLRHQLRSLSSKENFETSDMHLFDGKASTKDPKENCCDTSLKTQLLTMAAEIENLKQEKVSLTEEKDGLDIQCQKLAEEASYAKELASVAAVELRNLAEEVTRLSYENAKLTGELSVVKEQSFGRSNNTQRQSTMHVGNPDYTNSMRRLGDGFSINELHDVGLQREASLESGLADKHLIEVELQNIIEKGKLREQHLENKLANMWVLVSKLKRSGTLTEDVLTERIHENDFQPKRSGSFPSNGNCESRLMGQKHNGNLDGIETLDELRSAYDYGKKRCQELESIISRLKSEDLSGLDVSVLEELQTFHIEALSKICQEKLTNRVL